MRKIRILAIAPYEGMRLLLLETAKLLEISDRGFFLHVIISIMIMILLFRVVVLRLCLKVSWISQ